MSGTTDIKSSSSLHSPGPQVWRRSKLCLQTGRTITCYSSRERCVGAHCHCSRWSGTMSSFFAALSVVLASDGRMDGSTERGKHKDLLLLLLLLLYHVAAEWTELTVARDRVPCSRALQPCDTACQSNLQAPSEVHAVFTDPGRSHNEPTTGSWSYPNSGQHC